MMYLLSRQHISLLKSLLTSNVFTAGATSTWTSVLNLKLTCVYFIPTWGNRFHGTGLKKRLNLICDSAYMRSCYFSASSFVWNDSIYHMYWVGCYASVHKSLGFFIWKYLSSAIYRSRQSLALEPCGFKIGVDTGENDKLEFLTVYSPILQIPTIFCTACGLTATTAMQVLGSSRRRRSTRLLRSCGLRIWMTVVFGSILT